jgi:hypothetical protein
VIEKVEEKVVEDEEEAKFENVEVNHQNEY